LHKIKNMELSDYIEKRESINTKINSLNLELKKLERLYIDSNKEFSIKEKVILAKGTKKERFAFISNIIISNNKINYRLFRAKKDGQVSRFDDYLWFGETISKIEST
jgi:hypothetical protein